MRRELAGIGMRERVIALRVTWSARVRPMAPSMTPGTDKQTELTKITFWCLGEAKRIMDSRVPGQRFKIRSQDLGRMQWKIWDVIQGGQMPTGSAPVWLPGIRSPTTAGVAGAGDVLGTGPEAGAWPR